MVIEEIGDEKISGERVFSVSWKGVKFKVCKKHFVSPATPEEKMELFKKSVTRVVLETSSFCNRKCFFCPNCRGIRGEQGDLDREVFEKILLDLSLIRFSGRILFHLYNEPLASENIYYYLRKAHSCLPEAVLELNTNGDYLNLDSAKSLEAAGLKYLNVSVYGQDPGIYDIDKIKNRVLRIAEELGATVKAGGLNAQVKIQKMSVNIFAKNFGADGYDRGGLILSGNRTERFSPCSSPFSELIVSWRGNQIPCCNIHPDSIEHSAFIIGEMTAHNSIFDLYTSQSSIAWRKNMIGHGKKNGPCKNCTRMNDSDVNDEHYLLYNRKINSIS